jgi:hypothetical protein
MITLSDLADRLQDKAIAARAEMDDAAATTRLAEESATIRHRYAACLGALGFGVQITNCARDLAGSSVVRRAAAQDRQNAAEATGSVVRILEEALAPHFRIREHGQAAGGVAEQEAYKP